MEKTKNIPNHIAIIPDGNRRWARKHQLEVWFGHKKGTEGLEKLVDVMVDLRIPYLSFWGSSKDNLKKRSRQEVEFLLKLFKERFLELSLNNFKVSGRINSEISIIYSLLVICFCITF